MSKDQHMANPKWQPGDLETAIFGVSMFIVMPVGVLLALVLWDASWLVMSAAGFFAAWFIANGTFKARR